jgi:hypothetical protein
VRAAICIFPAKFRTDWSGAMRLSAIDRISPATPIVQLPIRLDLVGSRGSLAISLLLLVSAVVFLITPFVMVGSLAAFETDAFLKADITWFSGVQLAIAFLITLAFSVLALRRVQMAWGSAATVEIGHGVVAVVERRFGATRRWALPVSDFLGIAHNVRTSLSGARHELVLVHADPAYTVLICLAPAMPQLHVDRVAILLGLLEIPARSIANRAVRQMMVDQPAVGGASRLLDVSPPNGTAAPDNLRLAA